MNDKSNKIIRLAGLIHLRTIRNILNEDRVSRRRRRSMWTRKIYQEREAFGAHENLFREMELNDVESYRRYIRMDTSTFYEIAEAIRGSIEKTNTLIRPTIKAEERLAVTLRYLATGDSYRSLAYLYRIAPSTISLIVPEVCQAITTILGKRYLQTPNDAEGWQKVAEEFENIWQFPNCIGAIDGKHVVISKPANSVSHYYNYKQCFSIILMAVADAHYRFIYVDVGANGRVGDRNVWANCDFHHGLEDRKLNMPEPRKLGNQTFPYVLVGDEAFPLKTYMMRPYPRKDLNDEKKVFNYRLSRARRVIENAFGILTSVWRVYRSPMQLNVNNIRHVVLATTVLHNILRMKHGVSDLVDKEDLSTGCIVQGSMRQCSTDGVRSLGQVGSNSYSNEAKEVRENFCNYFNNDGQVSWQNKFLDRH